jgi:hypothetical protein
MRQSSHLQRMKFSRRSLLATLGAGAPVLFAACTAPTPAAPAQSTAAPAQSTAAPKPTAAAAPATTTAAAAPAQGAAAVAEIQIYAIDRDQDGGWQQQAYASDVDGFKSKNPNIKPVFNLVPGYTDQYWPKIFSLASTGQPFDIIWYPALHGGQLAWADRYQIVQPLDDLAKAANYDFSKNFFKAAIDGGTYGGKVYWLNTTGEPSLPVIAFNKTALDKLGADIPPEEMGLTGDYTWDDLKAWAKKVAPQGTPSYMPHPPELIGLISQLRQFGVEMVDKAGTKLDMPKENMTAWLQYRYDVLFTDKVSPPFTADPVGLFLEEKVLAVHAWPVFIDRMPKVLLKGKFDPAFRLLPVLKKGEKRRSNLNMHLYGVGGTRFSKNPQAAFSYLTWITGKEFAVQGILAGKGAPIARPDFWEDPRVYQQTPGEMLLKELMLNIEPDFIMANWQSSKFDQAFANTIQKMDLGQASVNDTYDKLAKDLQDILDLSPA